MHFLLFEGVELYCLVRFTYDADKLAYAGYIFCKVNKVFLSF